MRRAAVSLALFAGRLRGAGQSICLGREVPDPGNVERQAIKDVPAGAPDPSARPSSGRLWIVEEAADTASGRPRIRRSAGERRLEDRRRRPHCCRRCSGRPRAGARRRVGLRVSSGEPPRAPGCCREVRKYAPDASAAMALDPEKVPRLRGGCPGRRQRLSSSRRGSGVGGPQPHRRGPVPAAVHGLRVRRRSGRVGKRGPRFRGPRSLDETTSDVMTRMDLYTMYLRGSRAGRPSWRSTTCCRASIREGLIADMIVSRGRRSNRNLWPRRCPTGARERAAAPMPCVRAPRRDPDLQGERRAVIELFAREDRDPGGGRGDRPRL